MQHVTPFFLKKSAWPTLCRGSPKRPQEPLETGFSDLFRTVRLRRENGRSSFRCIPSREPPSAPAGRSHPRKKREPEHARIPGQLLHCGRSCLSAGSAAVAYRGGSFLLSGAPRQTVVRGPAAAGAAVCRGLSIVRCGAASGGRASTPCGRRPGRSRLRAAPVRNRAGACAGRPPSRGCARHRPA